MLPRRISYVHFGFVMLSSNCGANSNGGFLLKFPDYGVVRTHFSYFKIFTVTALPNKIMTYNSGKLLNAHSFCSS